ncbi:hypothetical protein, partial [Cardiobacterium hominis]|uniref:hypothetical protein n=1 Tax=Cardiobacterium hominis TaxID=2718 RepID=UPI0028E71749
MKPEAGILPGNRVAGSFTTVAHINRKTSHESRSDTQPLTALSLTTTNSERNPKMNNIALVLKTAEGHTIAHYDLNTARV